MTVLVYDQVSHMCYIMFTWSQFTCFIILVLLLLALPWGSNMFCASISGYRYICSKFITAPMIHDRGSDMIRVVLCDLYPCCFCKLLGLFSCICRLFWFVSCLCSLYALLPCSSSFLWIWSNWVWREVNFVSQRIWWWCRRVASPDILVLMSWMDTIMLFNFSS